MHYRRVRMEMKICYAQSVVVPLELEALKMHSDPPNCGAVQYVRLSNNIRNHTIRTFDFPSVNPTLDNDRLAIKTRMVVKTTYLIWHIYRMVFWSKQS